MTAAEKLRLAAQLSRTADAMAVAGIRAAHPGASDRECFLRLAIRRLGRELAACAYPEIARLED